MAMTGVTHFSSCDVIDREGKLRTNEFRPLTLCLGAIAISNQMVIIHSLFGQRESPTFDHIWSWDTPWQWSGNIASIQGEGILSHYNVQISALT